MNLTIQIKTILFSFFFGIFFSLGFELQKNRFSKPKQLMEFIFQFFYVFVNTLLFFLLMKKINNAIFHPYEILLLILGFIVGNEIFKMTQKKFHRM